MSAFSIACGLVAGTGRRARVRTSHRYRLMSGQVVSLKEGSTRQVILLNRSAGDNSATAWRPCPLSRQGEPRPSY